PLDPGRLERIEPRELDPARILRALGPRRTAVRSRGLDHRVPRAAIRALSLPLRLAGAACLADVYRLRFRHARSIADRTSAGPALENGVRHDFRGNRCQTPFFEIRSASQRRAATRWHTRIPARTPDNEPREGCCGFPARARPLRARQRARKDRKSVV